MLVRSTISQRGGAGFGTALAAAGALVTAAALSGCGSDGAGGARLPADFPRQVPINGTVLSVEKVDVGHPIWRVKVRGKDTSAAAEALTKAGFAPVTARTPLDVGRVGAVYRGGGSGSPITVGLSSYDGEITYVVDPPKAR